MIPGANTPCYPNGSQGIHHQTHMYTDVVETAGSSGGPTGGSDAQLGSLLCSLSIVKEKVQQVQSLLTSVFLSQENNNHQVINSSESNSMALASIGTLIQEIIVTSSSMMFNCQQIAIGSPKNGNNNNNNNNDSGYHHPMVVEGGGKQIAENSQGFLEGEGFFHWYSDITTNFNNNNNNNNNNTSKREDTSRTTTNIEIRKGIHKQEGKNMAQSTSRNKEASTTASSQDYHIVELDAADLLAKYTHYCQICGKGFKRDANLRMHMRAHGDEYKSSAALSNPLKSNNNNDNNNNNGENINGLMKLPKKYSCPQEGCRWNKNHAKFQPLKSMICVKNHYKRSHCPKMYVCKRCNRKQFSVLSDLRTHEKHCGDLKWQCSCGTTFSRKDKLMGHVALFIGHTPLISPLSNNSGNINKVDNQHQGLQIQFEDHPR